LLAFAQGAYSPGYIPPAVAVEHIAMQARGQAPAKPPRLVATSLGGSPPAPGPAYAAYDYALRPNSDDLHDHAEYAQQVR